MPFNNCPESEQKLPANASPKMWPYAFRVITCCEGAEPEAAVVGEDLSVFAGLGYASWKLAS